LDFRNLKQPKLEGLPVCLRCWLYSGQ